MPLRPSRDAPNVRELLPLAWAAALGGPVAAGLFFWAADPAFALAAALVAGVGCAGVVVLGGGRR